MKIIYPQKNGEIAITFELFGWSMHELALLTTPHNTPFLIVEDSVLPLNWETSAAWECDFSAPHGVGMGAHRYFIAQAEAQIVEILALSGPEQEPSLVAVTSEAFDYQELGEKPTDDQKSALYADYLLAVASYNNDVSVRHDAALAAFVTQQSIDHNRQLALIAQMKAEVLQLEGVTL